ncbi:TPA: hypothetical protein ACIF4C_003669 [Acinetobacter baumannii]
MQRRSDNVDEPGEPGRSGGYDDTSAGAAAERMQAPGCRGQRADTVRKAGRQLSGCSGERNAHHGKGGERHEQG